NAETVFLKNEWRQSRLPARAAMPDEQSLKQLRVPADGWYANQSGNLGLNRGLHPCRVRTGQADCLRRCDVPLPDCGLLPTPQPARPRAMHSKLTRSATRPVQERECGLRFCCFLRKNRSRAKWLCAAAASFVSTCFPTFYCLHRCQIQLIPCNGAPGSS